MPQPLDEVSLPLCIGLQRPAYSLEPGRGPHTAERRALEGTHFPAKALRHKPPRRERMLERSQEWHRRRSLIDQVQQQQQENAWRGLIERHASGVVDLDLPAP